MTRERLTRVSWVLLAVFTVGSMVFGRSADAGAGLGALLTLLQLVFFLVHASVTYRFRDVLAFAAITFVVSNLAENLSILTGFPFGNYYYTDILGPKLFNVPLLIGPAYLATGYLAWTLARVILGATGPGLSGRRTVTVPVLASFIMVSWDFSMDPITATIGHQWIWEDGGGYFGVPFSNFMGWYLTVFVFFQLFALYLRRRQGAYGQAQPEARAYWLQAALFYGVVALKFPLNLLTETTSTTIADPTGVLWRTHDIYVTCGLVSIFTMLMFTVVSLMRIAELPSTVPDRTARQAAASPVGSTG